jgi:hypothetical protein
VLGQPVFYLAAAVALVFVFALVNGISVGVSDSNPISSAFVVTIVILAALGLRDAGVWPDGRRGAAGGHRRGLRHAAGPLHRLAARHLARVLQFRYQVLGVVVGAVLAVVFARLFMAAYPCCCRTRP